MTDSSTQAWWVPTVEWEQPAGEQALTVRMDEPIDVRGDLQGDPPSGAEPRRRRRVTTVVAAAAVAASALGAGGWGLVTALRPEHPVALQTAGDAAFPVDPATVSASASSTQDTDAGVGYDAANTLDGDPTTAWNSNGARDGRGPGIWLAYRFASPVDLRAVSLLNGYQKVRRAPGRSAVDLYATNERLRRIRVVTDAGSWIWDLADRRARQTFAQIRGTTRSVRLEVISVYPSRRYPDLAVSEVTFTAAVKR